MVTIKLPKEINIDLPEEVNIDIDLNVCNHKIGNSKKEIEESSKVFSGRNFNY